MSVVIKHQCDECGEQIDKTTTEAFGAFPGSMTAPETWGAIGTLRNFEFCAACWNKILGVLPNILAKMKAASRPKWSAGEFK